MDRKGSAVIIILFVVVAIVALVFAGYWYTHRSYTHINPNPQLQATDIAPLVSFLQQNRLQAAVIQDVSEQDNAAYVWLVEADGQTHFIFSQDMGSCPTEWGTEPCAGVYDLAGRAIEAQLLPDQAAVADLFTNKYWDISSYLVGHPANRAWQSIFTTTFANANGAYIYDRKIATGGLSSLSISPDGKYEVHAVSSTSEIDQLVPDGGSYTLKMIQQFPTSTFLTWSVDGKYALFVQYGTGAPQYNAENEDKVFTYNLETGTVSISQSPGLYNYFDSDYGGKNQLNEQIAPENKDFISFIYPSVIIYEQSPTDFSSGVDEGGGTFILNNFPTSTAQRLGNGDEVDVLVNQGSNILPYNIKMVSFIN